MEQLHMSFHDATVIDSVGDNKDGDRIPSTCLVLSG
jgi:hypothetical protein